MHVKTLIMTVCDKSIEFTAYSQVPDQVALFIS